MSPHIYCHKEDDVNGIILKLARQIASNNSTRIKTKPHLKITAEGRDWDELVERVTATKFVYVPVQKGKNTVKMMSSENPGSTAKLKIASTVSPN